MYEFVQIEGLLGVTGSLYLDSVAGADRGALAAGRGRP
jgi:hypothetical protein